MVAATGHHPPFGPEVVAFSPKWERGGSLASPRLGQPPMGGSGLGLSTLPAQGLQPLCASPYKLPRVEVPRVGREKSKERLRKKKLQPQGGSFLHLICGDVRKDEAPGSGEAHLEWWIQGS